MEIEEAWAPIITEPEIRKHGVLLDNSLLVKPVSGGNDSLKIQCKLYYLKHRDLFVTVMNDFVTVNDVPPIQVVSDSLRLHAFRKDYLKQTPADSNDMFVEVDTNTHAPYSSDFDLSNTKQYGKFLETFSGYDLYYVEQLDAFVQIGSDHPPSTFQNPALRKKYNIPYQDERMASFI